VPQRFFFFNNIGKDVADVTINNRQYFSIIKPEEDGSVFYIFFSLELYNEQMQI
jgi:hypothetical protein